MTMAMAGIRIIDMTIWQHGPVSTCMLADMGAEVIKVETRDTGDPGRYLTTWTFDDLEDDDEVRLNYYWENNNRNKKSLAIDLKTEEGMEVMYRLIEKSDAFVSNFREKSLVKLGLGYEKVHEINPKLVYSLGYGFGAKGPDASRPSADLGAQARGGIMSQSFSPAPRLVWGGLADQTGAFMLCLGTTMGLLTRERTGIGQKVEESLFGTQLAVGALMAQGTLFSGQVPTEYTRSALSPFWNVYKCKDDKWLAFSVLELDRYWPILCKVLDLEWLLEDPRFKEGKDRVETRADELIDILDDAMAKKTRADWTDILNGTDIIWAPVQDYAEALNDPQAIENEYVVEYDHPNAGKVKVLGLPLRFSETPGKVRNLAPELGQHTEELLTETLGYTWDQVESLKGKKVI